MITRRPAEARGHAEHGWLDTWHTFSFAEYFDPRHTGFRHLRVINEDRVAPGAGFDTHGHRDMEILTWPLEGVIEHRDNMGNRSMLHAGEIQRMTAGTGIMHSEHNGSSTERLHLLQIWIQPATRGLTPGYEQRGFDREELRGRLRPVAARDGRDGAVTIHQDVDLYVSLLEPGEAVSHRLEPGRHAWVQVARGAVALNGVALKAGDGAAVSEEEELRLEASSSAEVLLFDLA